MTRLARLLGRYQGLFLAMGLLVVIPACGDGEESDTSEESAAKKSRKSKKKKKKDKDKKKETVSEAAVVEEGPAVEYVYNPLGKRDPFKSFLKLEQNRQQPTTPLQRYDLDQYRLVGIVSGGAEPLAMVEDPEGNGHFLRPGTLIGKNWGKVVRISGGNVVVAEETTDIQGQLHVNEIVLEMVEDG